MSALRNLWEDLVDRRLWPVALALVLALIAVPLLLSTPAPEEEAQTTTAAPTAPPPPPGLAAAISDVTGTAYVGPVRGDARDPFRPQGAGGGSQDPAASTALGGATPGQAFAPGLGAGAGLMGSAGSSAPGPAGSGSGSGSTPAPATGEPIPAARPTTVVALEFGLLGGEAGDRRVAELTPLPSPVSPAVVYLGQTRAGESAFLVSSDARAAGQGRCTPNRRTCSTLYLRPGQVAYLTVDTTAGPSVRYRLKFVRRLPV